MSKASYAPVVASRLHEMTPFQAVEVFQAARALEEQGRHIIHLEFGEPDFPTPSPVKEAAIRAMIDGHTKYTHSLGIPELRETICHYHQAKYGTDIVPDQILVSQGTSLLMHLLMLTLLEEGDEIILPDPTYACYASFIHLAGGRPVYVAAGEDVGFQIDPDDVRAAITPRTKAILLCSPANPTGVVIRPEVMRALAEMGVPIISDEIYHGLTYAGAEHSALEFSDRAFVLNGFSKYFAMTGWRLGYLIFPPALRERIQTLHQNVMISTTDFVQHAAIAAMERSIPECESYKAEYDRRRVYVIDKLAQIGLPLKYEPVGAFYCFADARAYSGDSLAFAMEILHGAGVALTPGIDFGPGGEGYLRISYANSLESIGEGLDRLGTFLRNRPVAGKAKKTRAR